MIFIVYETTNLGKKYRGIHQTCDLDDGYLGSGLALSHAVKKYGKHNFNRVVLEYCSSFYELIEKEKLYVDIDWVKSKNNYNLKTGGHSAGILSDASKLKISETLKRKYKSGEILPQSPNKDIPNTAEQKQKISNTLKKRYKNKVHHRKGEDPWNKGTKGAQEAWNKGKLMGPMSEENKMKISETLKEKYKHEQHHQTGKEPWNKGTKGKQEAWNKGIKLEQLECPHCGKKSDMSNLKRWHLDNCKKKGGQI